MINKRTIKSRLYLGSLGVQEIVNQEVLCWKCHKWYNILDCFISIKKHKTTYVCKSGHEMEEKVDEKT